ncbi:MAG: tetratricopeptide repeat protein [bacterium]|nr:tetratricopeptide repeat protein [bacterium]
MKTLFLVISVLGLTALGIPGCSSTAARQDLVQTAADGEEFRPVPRVDKRAAEELDYRAYEFYVNGLLYEGIGDLRNAAASYRKALQVYPDSYEIGFALAEIAYRMRQPDQALEVLEQIALKTVDVFRLEGACYQQTGDERAAKDAYLNAIALDSTQENAYIFLAGYYRRRNNLDSTAWTYHQLIRMQPENYELRNELGKMLALGGRPEEAKTVFRESLAMNPSIDNVAAYLSLSELYELTEQVDTAKVVLKEGLEVSPDNMMLNRAVVRLYLEADSVLGAIPYVRSLAEAAPQDADASRRLAIMYFTVDSLPQADSVLSALVGSGDIEPANHFYLGRIALIGEDYTRARDEFTTLTHLADSISDGWLGLGLAFNHLGDSAQELETYRTGLEFMRDEESAVALYFALGAAFEQADAIDSATATFEEILKHDPDNAQTLNYLGYALADRNLRLEYARDLISRAVELKPNSAAFLDSYGWVYYRLAEYEKALEYLEAAAKLDNDPVIFDHLGDAYLATGKPEEAKVWWRKALEQQPDNTTIKEKLGVESLPPSADKP